MEIEIRSVAAWVVEAGRGWGMTRKGHEEFLEEWKYSIS